MNFSIGFIILVGFLLRLVIAVWNGFYGPSPGAEFDAQGFNGFASEVAATGVFDDFSIGFTPYTNLLGLVYNLTFNHIFIGSLLSCLVWWMSAIVLSKSFILLAVRKQQIKKAMLIYALLPSSIFLTSVTLREPYQLLFVNIAMYAVLNIYLQKAYRHWITLIFAVIAAGILHGGLLAFEILFFVGALLLVFARGRGRNLWLKALLIGVISVTLLWGGFSLFGHISYSLDDGLNVAVLNYQESLLSDDARTNYKEDVAISDTNSPPVFILVGFVKYLLEPFPWHVSTTSDMIALLENIFRAWLILKAWKTLHTASDQQRKVLFFTFISCLIMEMIWSLGTINWGTSIRHHLPAWGLLLIAAYGIATTNENYAKTRMLRAFNIKPTR